MSDPSVSTLNGFRYTDTANVQNTDMFNMIKDIKNNIFDPADTNKDGILSSDEASKAKITDQNGNSVLLFDSNRNGNVGTGELDCYNLDKNDSGISLYETAAACLENDIADGSKDGVIGYDGYQNLSMSSLKNEIYPSIQNWKTNTYDPTAQQKLQQGIQMLKDNKDCIPADVRDNIFNDLNNIPIQVADDLPGNCAARFNYPDGVNPWISVNKQEAYEKSPEQIAGELVHELTHYEQYKKDPNNTDFKQDTLAVEEPAFSNEYEFDRNLENKENSSPIGYLLQASDAVGLTGTLKLLTGKDISNKNFQNDPDYADYKETCILSAADTDEQAKNAKMKDILDTIAGRYAGSAV